MKLRISQALVAIGLSLLPAAAAAQSYTIAPSPFLVAQDNSGKIINNACIWSYVAGTTTAATTYADTAGTPNSNPIRSDSAGRFTVYLLAGSNYKFVYESSCTPPSHGTVLRTADPIAGTPASAATVDVTGFAGETISAGQCAYLSVGSGGKSATQWYKCDAANAYSSTVPTLGLAVNAIVSGSTGTIRLQGAVSGLAVSAGSTYYVGTAGAITATAPVQARRLGDADASTSLILKDLAPPTQAWVDDFRLTLTSGTPVTTTDVTAATTIYCSPYTGNRLDLPDSLGNPQRVTSAEFSIAVPATTSQMYDVFAFNNAGVATLELLAWTNDTTRATAIVRTNGRWMKSGDSTRLYLASFRTTTVSGQTEDSLAKRLVWNYYNRVPRTLRRLEATPSWTYTTLTWRQANASTSNQLAVVVGVAEVPITLALRVPSSNSVGGAAVYGFVAIGENSTTTPHAACSIVPDVNVNAGSFASGGANSHLDTFPAVGYSFYAWLEEATAGTGTTTFYGANAGTATSAFSGSIPG